TTLFRSLGPIGGHAQGHSHQEAYDRQECLRSTKEIQIFISHWASQLHCQCRPACLAVKNSTNRASRIDAPCCAPLPGSIFPVPVRPFSRLWRERCPSCRAQYRPAPSGDTRCWLAI